MKVTYNKPKKNNFEYKRWFDNVVTFDIWYKDVVYLYDYHNLNIPNELKIFLDKWNKKLLEYKKNFVEQYPVKLARIKFIYDNIVYAIYPKNVSASYMTDFMSNEVSWDSLFEEYEREIKDVLEKELVVKHSRYWGMLD